MSDNKPRVTDNARLLLGYMAGVLIKHGEDRYRFVEANAAAGHQTIEHVATGNIYRMTIEQIGGIE